MLKAAGHKGDARITRQKKRSYEKAFEGHNQEDILVRDSLQTVQQKHDEEMQSSAQQINEECNYIFKTEKKKKKTMHN